MSETPEKITITEMTNSLTGFEEIAAAKAFKAEMEDLVNSSKFGRALVFVDLRRRPMPDTEAYEQAMSMRLGDVNTYFAEEGDDVDEEDPDSESGKESAQLATAPQS